MSQFTDCKIKRADLKIRVYAGLSSAILNWFYNARVHKGNLGSIAVDKARLTRVAGDAAGSAFWRGSCSARFTRFWGGRLLKARKRNCAGGKLLTEPVS